MIRPIGSVGARSLVISDIEQRENKDPSKFTRIFQSDPTQKEALQEHP